MFTFLLWCILFVVCWPLALLAWFSIHSFGFCCCRSGWLGLLSTARWSWLGGGYAAGAAAKRSVSDLRTRLVSTIPGRHRLNYNLRRTTSVAVWKGERLRCAGHRKGSSRGCEQETRDFAAGSLASKNNFEVRLEPQTGDPWLKHLNTVSDEVEPCPGHARACLSSPEDPRFARANSKDSTQVSKQCNSPCACIPAFTL